MTKQPALHLLVWYEFPADLESAIAREKALKNWKREWKVRLLEMTNPNWADLYDPLR